jgi:hypothetical protein
MRRKKEPFDTSHGQRQEKVFDEPSTSKPKTKSKSGSSPDEECFHYHKKGHWFRNCKNYLREKKK